MFDDPCFTVYLKSNTIHVFKSAIRSIGNPNYVRLFIHEDGKTILMKSYDKKSQISIKVPRNLSDEKKQHEDSQQEFLLRFGKIAGMGLAVFLPRSGHSKQRARHRDFRSDESGNNIREFH